MKKLIIIVLIVLLAGCATTGTVSRQDASGQQQTTNARFWQAMDDLGIGVILGSLLQ